MIKKEFILSPQISVIVPIYNVEKYVANCIESIQNQTLKNIEIILVNDGTLDRSAEIAEEFSKKDNRIKIIHKKNAGLSSARNEGLLIAKGEYISFIDSDDWIEPLMLEDLYVAAKKVDADIVVSGVIVEYTKENRIVIDNVTTNISNKNSSESGIIFWQLQKVKLSNYVWNKLYKNTFIDNNNLKFIENAMPAEDLFFNLSAFKKANSIAVINKAYYHYLRRDEASILSIYQKNLIAVEVNRKAFYVDFLNHFNMHGEEYSEFLNRLLIDGKTGVVMNLYRNGVPYNRKERIKIISKNIFENNELENNISKYNPQNLYEKIFVVLYKFSNPFFMELTYGILFLLRRTFIGLYLKLRKNELG